MEQGRKGWPWVTWRSLTLTAFCGEDTREPLNSCTLLLPVLPSSVAASKLIVLTARVRRLRTCAHRGKGLSLTVTCACWGRLVRFGRRLS
ncbi:hypothetical protein BD311DRAFT_766920 [Dichomitus squalens]|uniref:Uncharacterized protein n=1 Tax=Dichomitus squalens TaxID=114155 RepID=A0A4Q9MDY1_9APHY|nr:hypothetical protein BD311DRAFT_766920 [Dichomitus squalens]